MDVSVDEKSPVSKIVSVTLEANALDRDIDKRLAKLSKRVKIHGFRPGKAPRKLLIKKYGPGVRMDAIDAAVRSGMEEALAHEDLTGTVHVSRPDLISGANEDEPVAFRFVAERLPEIEVADYEGVEVPILAVDVSDEDVAAELEKMQNENVAIVPVEDRDVVEAEDVVIVTYEGVGEGDVAEIRSEDQQIDLTDPALLDGFAAGLAGAKVGDAKTIEVELPENFSLESIAGKKVNLSVTVSEIKRRDVPALDDDFAADRGDFDTLDALKADIKKNLLEARTSEGELGAKRRLVATIVAANPVDLPPLYVEARAMDEAQQRLRQLASQGLDLSALGGEISSFAASMRTDVAAAIHESVVMRAIAKAGEVEIAEDAIEAHLEKLAKEGGQPLARLKAQFSRPEMRDQLRGRLAYEATLDLIWSKAKVKTVDELPPEPEPVPYEPPVNPSHGEDGHVHGPDCDH